MFAPESSKYFLFTCACLTTSKDTYGCLSSFPFTFVPWSSRPCRIADHSSPKSLVCRKLARSQLGKKRLPAAREAEVCQRVRMSVCLCVRVCVHASRHADSSLTNHFPWEALPLVCVRCFPVPSGPTHIPTLSLFFFAEHQWPRGRCWRRAAAAVEDRVRQDRVREAQDWYAVCALLGPNFSSCASILEIKVSQHA